MSAKKNYKHQKTTSFNRGMGQYVIEDDKKFFLSENVRANENGKLTLANDFNEVYSIDTVFHGSYYSKSNNFFSASNNNYCFILGVDSSKNFKIYRSDDGETWELLTSFATASGSPILFIAFKSFLIITTFAKEYYFSEDNGETWDTVSNSSLPFAPYFKYFVEYNNRLYLASDNAIGYIENPSEGYVLWHYSDEPSFYGFDGIRDIFVLHDSLYFVNFKTVYLIVDSSFKKVFSLRNYSWLAKFENVVYFLLPSTEFLSLYVFDGISLNFKSSFSKIKSFPIYPVLSTDDYFIFQVHNSKTVTFYKLLKDGSLFFDNTRVYTTFLTSIMSGFVFNNINYYLELLLDPDPNEFILYQEYGSVPAGTLTQSMLVEPEMIPQGIMIVTDPLPSGTSVKVYHSSNGGTSFGSVLINHNIENATSAKYFFPAGTKIDLSMIKLELLSTSGGSPIVHYIDYFYTPSGVSTL